MQPQQQGDDWAPAHEHSGEDDEEEDPDTWRREGVLVGGHMGGLMRQLQQGAAWGAPPAQTGGGGGGGAGGDAGAVYGGEGAGGVGEGAAPAQMAFQAAVARLEAARAALEAAAAAGTQTGTGDRAGEAVDQGDEQLAAETEGGEGESQVRESKSAKKRRKKAERLEAERQRQQERLEREPPPPAEVAAMAGRQRPVDELLACGNVWGMSRWAVAAQVFFHHCRKPPLRNMHRAVSVAYGSENSRGNNYVTARIQTCLQPKQMSQPALNLRDPRPERRALHDTLARLRYVRLLAAVRELQEEYGRVQEELKVSRSPRRARAVPSLHVTPMWLQLWPMTASHGRKSPSMRAKPLPAWLPLPTSIPAALPGRVRPGRPGGAVRRPGGGHDHLWRGAAAEAGGGAAAKGG